MDLTDNQIQNILSSYKKKREREKKYYHEVLKYDEEYKNKNKQRSKEHYHNKNKEKKKEYYEKNKDILNLKSLYNYYLKKDMLDKFKNKHNEKYNILVSKGIIVT